MARRPRALFSGLDRFCLMASLGDVRKDVERTRPHRGNQGRPRSEPFAQFTLNITSPRLPWSPPCQQTWIFVAMRHKLLDDRLRGRSLHCGSNRLTIKIG